MMKRLAFALAMIPALAFGQSSPNWPTGYRPSTQEMNAEWASKRDYAPNPIPSPGTAILYAIDYGVIPDGVTSNDVQLKTAVDACAAIGTALYLPPGKILLTGVVTINLKNCALVGVGAPIGTTTGAIGGTTILLTSTSTIPFMIFTGWSVSGVNFYWPNQTNGTTVYPTLFGDDGSYCAGRGFVDHVTIVNAYKGFTSTSSCGWGNIIISNSNIYAVKAALELNKIGDSILVANTGFSPGPWLAICGFSGPCMAAINAAANVNSVVHATAAGGGVININIDANSYAEAWRYGLLIDATGFVGESKFQLGYDGVGTLIDASSGGTYASANYFSTGFAGCSIAVFGGSGNIGNTPCFNMGANSYLIISEFHGSSRGSLATLSGGAFVMRNGTVDGLGFAADGADYYVLRVTGGTPIITLQNNSFQGNVADVHTHGVVTGANVPLTMTIQNNSFIYFNDDLNVQSSSNVALITGNTSQSTTGAASITIAGTNQVISANNRWDKAPVSTLTSCGTSPVSQSAFSGLFVTGTGSPTSCTIKFPWVPYGFGVGACTFQTTQPTVIVGAAPAAIDTWTVTFSTGYNGAAVYYHCPGQQ